MCLFNFGNKTVKFYFRIDFPFLVFLASGGHCLLAVARDVDDFLLLGTTVDTSPGEVFDKVYYFYMPIL